MNRSAKRQRHEQSRKKHKHDLQQHARQTAKADRSKTPRWLLVGGVALILVFAMSMAFGR